MCGINLAKKIKSYQNKSKLNSSSRLITESLLKYKYFNFTSHIMEYCSENIFIDREFFYFNILVSEYNILKHANWLINYNYGKNNRKIKT